MTPENKDQPAFPTPTAGSTDGCVYSDAEVHNGESWGLTKREHFAAKAMQGMLSALGTRGGCEDMVDVVAEAAYRVADVMLNATTTTEEIQPRIEIFDNKEAFLQRKDKSTNGVSVDFALNNAMYAEMNATNIGCWNCKDCSHCHYCSNCESCDYCSECEYCKYCSHYNNGIGSPDQAEASTTECALEHAHEP